MTRSPDAVLARLAGLYPKAIDLSLGRVRHLLGRLGNPQDRLPPVVHIAGTNGKGSTVATLRAILEAAGYRVHAYTSPHLVRFNERIRLAGALIDDAALVDLLDEIERTNDDTPITFFEITTAAAFLGFARTPALMMPALSSAISMDHMNFLGQRVAEEIHMVHRDRRALGMLTCIKKAFALLETQGCKIDDMADLPPDQPDVYAMISDADTIGVFQIESRAQMSMLPRLRPANFYDLVIEVAIVRPGPIQGDMVHPYLKRRSGAEKVVYPAPSPDHGPEHELKEVLGRTLGVPLFQEQAMQLAMVAAEFKAHEADGLRRAMATFRNKGTIHEYKVMLIEGMVRRGYEREFAERCFKQIEGFGSYGFPESHAASFAKLVYVSAFLKCRYPAVFAAALLNSQPMGFYAPAQIVRDAREHGVEVRPVDVEHSAWDCTLEDAVPGRPALRLGFRQIDGFSKGWADKLIDARRDGFGNFDHLARYSGLTQAQLQRLADADAMRSLGLDRRQALWQVRGVARGAPAPLLQHLPDEEVMVDLPALSLAQHVLADYQTTRLSLKAHPMSFFRQIFAAQGVLPCADLSGLGDKARAAVAGVVLVRQRPGTGVVCFITLEDESGVANLVVMPEVFEKYRRVIMSARLLAVHGLIQKSPEGIVHMQAHRLVDRTAELKRLDEEADLFAGLPETLARADHVKTNGPTGGARHPRNVRVILPSRDFH